MDFFRNKVDPKEKKKNTSDHMVLTCDPFSQNLYISTTWRKTRCSSRTPKARGWKLTQHKKPRSTNLPLSLLSPLKFYIKFNKSLEVLVSEHTVLLFVNEDLIVDYQKQFFFFFKLHWQQLNPSLNLNSIPCSLSLLGLTLMALVGTSFWVSYMFGYDLII